MSMPLCSTFTGYVNAAVQHFHRLRHNVAVQYFCTGYVTMSLCSIFTGYVTMSLCSTFTGYVTIPPCSFFLKPAMSQYRRSIFTGYINAAVQYFHRLCQCRCSIFIGCQCRLGPRPAPPVSCTYTNDRRSKCGLHAVINVYTVYMTHTVCWAAAL